MTQLPAQGAVGGSDEPVIAAEPTLQDRFAAVAGDEEEKKPEEGEASEAAIAAEAEASLTAEDAAEAEAEDAEQGEPKPIAPPTSWTAEEQEEFKQLPPAAQKTIARREAEREKFVQSKSLEAKQARAQVEQEAVSAITQMQGTYAQQLQALLPQIPAKPDHMLQADDPWAYAEQMNAHDNAVAQHQWVQQQLQGIAHQQNAVQQAAMAQRNQETAAVLQEKFPDYLDAAKGPELKQKLASTALELGFSEEQLADVDHRDILAMKAATEWREKAAKYDSIMATKMEKVREAKGMPKVSRPGTAQGKGAVVNQRYTEDRKAMRNGDRDAAARVFSKFI